MRLGELAGGDRLARQEGVEVGDDDLGLAELLERFGGNEVALRGSSCRGRWAAGRAGGRGW